MFLFLFVLFLHLHDFKKGGAGETDQEKKKNEGVVLHRKVKRNMKEVKESEA